MMKTVDISPDIAIDRNIGLQIVQIKIYSCSILLTIIGSKIATYNVKLIKKSKCINNTHLFIVFGSCKDNWSVTRFIVSKIQRQNLETSHGCCYFPCRKIIANIHKGCWKLRSLMKLCAAL